MPAIANSYHACELLNLGYGRNGRGPFLIRQEGSAPGSLTLRKERFLLRKDGTWVLSLLVFTLPVEHQQHFLYEDAAEASNLLRELAGNPRVEHELPPHLSPEELLAAAKATLNSFWHQMERAESSRFQV